LKLTGKKVKFLDADEQGNDITIKGTITKAADTIQIPVAIKHKGKEGEEIIEFRLIPLSALEEDKDK